MGTLTDNFSFQKPTIGADSTTWGNDYVGGDPLVDPSPGLNGNWEKLDQVFKLQNDKITELQAVVDALPDNMDQFRIQIGGLHVSKLPENPATKLGYGTWEQWGMGRALVAAGDSGEYDWAVDEERGTETHTLIEDEIPAHSHDMAATSKTTNSNGAHTHSFTGTPGTLSSGNSGTGTKRGDSKTSSTTGNHTHSFNPPSTTSTQLGGGLAHTNIMPSKAAYIWKRTA